MDISIDIGTSFSSICMKDRSDKISPVYVKTGVNMFGNDFAIPTAVCIDGDGNLKLGQAAMNIRRQYPSNFAGGFKRNLGEDFPIHLGNEDFSPEELYSRIFIYFKECAEKVSTEKIDKVFITYPASYTKNDPRKYKIIGAAKAAGLFNVTLIDEPTAAAMNYMEAGLLPAGARDLMIYDFGGGTFDVSLLRYENGKFELICEPGGDPECGGIDIDRMIYKDIMNQLKEQFPDFIVKLAKVPIRMMRLNAVIQEEAVKAKHELTTSKSIQQVIPIGFDNMIYSLTREKFDGMISHLAANSITACRNILEKAGMKASGLSAVIMVGGTSRVPLVQSMLKKFAGQVPVLCAGNMDLAVVEGALKYDSPDRQTRKDPVHKKTEPQKNEPQKNEQKISGSKEPAKGRGKVSDPASEKTDWTKNVFRSDRLNECRADSAVFGTGLKRSQVVEAAFIDKIKNAPDISYDISENGDRSVLLWFEAVGYEKYRMLIGANGGVNAKNCERLFENYINLKNVDLNRCFHPDQAASTAGLFACCHSLEHVDLSGVNTSGVENMAAMFDGCFALRNVDVSSFDTGRVRYMNAMFRDCRKLEYLDLSGFKFEMASDISSMFKNCESLRNIKRQDIYVPNCRDMSYVFYRCLKLEQFDKILEYPGSGNSSGHVKIAADKDAFTYCYATKRKYHDTEINFVPSATGGKPFSGGKRVFPRTPFPKTADFALPERQS